MVGWLKEVMFVIDEVAVRMWSCAVVAVEVSV